MVPKAVLIRSGLVSLTTARPVNNAQPRSTVNSARPMTNVFNKAHSTVRRSINNKTTTKKSNFNQGVNTVKDKNVKVARPKSVVNTAKPKAVLNAVKRNQVNAVKASACWVWKLKTKGNPQMDLQDQGVIDSGCSRHMTENMCLVSILNTIDHLGKFDGKADEEFFDGPNWLFDINALTKSMNYNPVVAGNQSNGNAGTKACDDAISPDARFKPSGDNEKKVTEKPGKEGDGCQYALLYVKIEGGVLVCQPPGFEDPYFPNRVYKVEKALYRLHQALRAWYETLSTYLLDNEFQKGEIDKTLFIRNWVQKFEKMMHKKFQMSSIGELTFFLGLQVKQKEDGIFISQDKYVTEILKKFSFTDVTTTSTPMET
ncbi:putative ribonuclease H-like domain-containing protein [Tanacetum coccineum]